MINAKDSGLWDISRALEYIMNDRVRCMIEVPTPKERKGTLGDLSRAPSSDGFRAECRHVVRGHALPQLPGNKSSRICVAARAIDEINVIHILTCVQSVAQNQLPASLEGE